MHRNKKSSITKVYRINSPLRLCIFITIVVFIIISLLASIWIKGKAMEPVKLISIEASEGDTLWSIAKQSSPSNRDIRDYILELKSVNDLEDANIKVGQTILVPVYD